MRPLKGNLLSAGRYVSPTDGNGRRPGKFFYSPVLVALLFVISFAFGRVSLSGTGETTFSEWGGIPLLNQMKHLIRSPDRKLIGEKEDRINILLLGMGGEGHDGPYLTDTIIVASIRPSDNAVALLSIPRDLLVPLPDFGWRKINAANAFGEIRTRGRGGDFARSVVEGLLGIDIPYYVRVDFDGFTDLIDSVGGVDIHVDTAFKDYTYPTDDYLTQTVSFGEGWQTMDGDTALTFARSRHGTNGEGSDFARAKRQQKVLAAVKKKFLSLRTYRNPSVISNTLASLQSHISTNINLGGILRLVKMAQRIDTEHGVSHEVLDDGPNGALVARIVSGAYVLVPKNNDWESLRDVAVNLFDIAEQDTTPAAPTDPALTEEPGKVEIRNGSGKIGLARTTAGKIAELGLRVVKIGNADSFFYTKTTIYDLTGGEKPGSLAKLKRAIPDATIDDDLPHILEGTITSDITDFLVILGAPDADDRS